LAENMTIRSVKRWLSREKDDSPPNAEAFAHLYQKTQLSVFRYVYGLSGGSQQEAEDLTAETYARAWKSHQGFTGNDQAALGWLLRIARNLVIDQSRKHGRHNLDDEVDVELLVDPNQVPEADFMVREQISTLWRMLSTLESEQREMLVLRYMLDWQVKQIAQHLDMTENNVSVSIRRLLNRLQRDWSELQENDNDK